MSSKSLDKRVSLGLVKKGRVGMLKAWVSLSRKSTTNLQDNVT